MEAWELKQQYTAAAAKDATEVSINELRQSTLSIFNVYYANSIDIEIYICYNVETNTITAY